MQSGWPWHHWCLEAVDEHHDVFDVLHSGWSWRLNRVSNTVEDVDVSSIWMHLMTFYVLGVCCSGWPWCLMCLTPWWMTLMSEVSECNGWSPRRLRCLYSSLSTAPYCQLCGHCNEVTMPNTGKRGQQDHELPVMQPWYLLFYIHSIGVTLNQFERSHFCFGLVAWDWRIRQFWTKWWMCVERLWAKNRRP